MNTSIHLTAEAITVDSGDSYSIPIMIASNDDYDEDQDQKAEEKIPIAENLIFMRYSTDEDGNIVDTTNEENTDSPTGTQTAKIGYVFYYPELNDLCKIVECDPNKENMREELKSFEAWICKILYVINERKKLKASSRSKTYMAQQDKRVSKYCIQTDLSVLLAQQVIGDIFFKHVEESNDSQEAEFG